MTDNIKINVPIRVALREKVGRLDYIKFITHPISKDMDTIPNCTSSDNGEIYILEGRGESSIVSRIASDIEVGKWYGEDDVGLTLKLTPQDRRELKNLHEPDLVWLVGVMNRFKHPQHIGCAFSFEEAITKFVSSSSSNPYTNFQARLADESQSNRLIVGARMSDPLRISLSCTYTCGGI